MEKRIQSKAVLLPFFLAVVCVRSLLAGSISEVSFPAPAGELYTWSGSSEFAGPFDDPAFAALGEPPMAFLFTANTSNNSNGVPAITIVRSLPSAAPAATFAMDAASAPINPVPEPGPVWLLGIGLLAIAFGLAYRSPRESD